MEFDGEIECLRLAKMTQVNWWLSSTGCLLSRGGLAAGTSSPNAFVPLQTPRVEPFAPPQL